MPWFVNASSDFPTADFYAEQVARILELDDAAWEKEAMDVREKDKAMSNEFVRKGFSHYAIKYNPFMGVISDYFTAEDHS